MADVATTETPEQRADQSVATRFTRPMNAATSPLGVLTDPPFIAIGTGLGICVLLGVISSGVRGVVIPVLIVLSLLPIVCAVVVSVILAGARRSVVSWLARQPFPVENMNAVLNGLGDELEVTFADTIPTAEALNLELDKVHPDSFVTGTVEETRTIEIRIGVVDSKRNPSASNHQRYQRVIALVEQVLVPTAERHPIRSVRVR
ncbi:hypothetical protein [Chondromyces crocatus]|uniref:Uncharacterized protein n=1 Tax=Chondromyces crocatus TaxID=52 RepID=A0A0K1EHL9_CHOCO|nr:hypothetical protein [Chondromyces crocatus]AKT40360.1 uncharacterized protein CMC5_045130 [Chondromyces crocatus]